jgi:hypothetical protein
MVMLTPLLLFLAADLLNDPFAGTALAKEWTVAKGDWKIVDGKLKGVEIPADKHAAVVRRNVKFTDGVIRYAVMLAGARAAHLSINGAKGHICRLILTPASVELRKDKANAKSGDKPVRLAHQVASFTPGAWYHVEVSLKGRTMAARVAPGAGKAALVALSGDHDGIAVEKTNIGFPVMGSSAWFDDVRVVVPGPAER